MHNGAARLFNIESITESVVEDAASELITRVLDFVFSNMGIILLIVIAVLFVIIFFVAGTKRKFEKNQLKEVRQLFKDKNSELDRIMLSDLLKDLERGLIQGNTKDILMRLEQRLLASHNYSEQLHRKLDNQKIPLFSMIEFSNQIRELQDEVYAFAEQVDYYANELAGINNITKQTAGFVQPVQQKYAEIAENIERISVKSSYPLDELRKLQRQVEVDVNRAAQSGNFDAVRAQADVQKAHQAIDYLNDLTVKLEKDIGLFRQMKLRMQERSGQLPEDISIQLEKRMQRLEDDLRAGAEVNLRAAEIEIEQMLSPR